jgi:lactate permease
MFVQVLSPLGQAWLDAALAVLPLVVVLGLSAGLRVSAWAAVLLAAAVTLALAVGIWHAPLGDTVTAFGIGAATGVWSVDWIVLWGVLIYNTMVHTGAFSALYEWLVTAAGPDVRVQVLVLAWGFGALLEGLVGFGYPWAVVAPILIGLGLREMAALRAAALGNNAPVSFGALGAPIIALAAVTGLTVNELSAAIGLLVAVLALAPPFLLIFLVSGWSGLRTGWPLGVVAALGFVAGQLPTALFLGPYLPAVIGALTCLAALLLFVRLRRRAPVMQAVLDTAQLRLIHDGPTTRRPRALRAGITPIGVLVVVMIAWTGPWSTLPRFVPFRLSVTADGSLGRPVAVTFSWAPFAAGTAALLVWLLVLVYLLPFGHQIRAAVRDTGRQMWGALLVAPLIFGLAAVFNYAGLANTLAATFAGLGPGYLLLAPLLGWVAVALSGSNTSANTLFGAFQLTLGRLLGLPLVVLPALNSVGAAVGKPIAPQTASVGVATTGHVRREGEIIRHNLPWALGLLCYLLLITYALALLLPHLG